MRFEHCCRLIYAELDFSVTFCSWVVAQNFAWIDGTGDGVDLNYYCSGWEL